MKKLIATLGFLFIAIGANLHPVITEDLAYDNAGSYGGDVHATTDYKSLYKSYIGSASSAIDGCNIRVRTLSGPEKQAYWIDKPVLNGRAYFAPVPKEEFGARQGEPFHWIKTDTSDEGNAIYPNAPKPYAILAPEYMTIETKAASSAHGTYMELVNSNKKYKLVFSNMARWYCCIDRAPRVEFGTTKFKEIKEPLSHTEDACHTVLGAGSVVGVGTKSTTVTAYKNTATPEEPEWSPITLEEYYKRL